LLERKCLLAIRIVALNYLDMWSHVAGNDVAAFRTEYVVHYAARGF
jgi:hypothetical protein